MPQRRVHGPERKRKNWGVQAEGLSGEWRVAAAVSLMDPSGLHTATVRRGQSAGAGRRSVPGPAGLLPTPPARLSRFVVRACLRALSRKPPPNRTASATAQGPLQVQGLTKSAHPGAEGGSTPQALPNFNEEIQEKSSRQGVSRSASSPTAQLGVGPPHTSCRNEVTPAGDASVWSEERQVFRVTLRTLPPPPGSLPSCGPLSSALPPPSRLAPASAPPRSDPAAGDGPHGQASPTTAEGKGPPQGWVERRLVQQGGGDHPYPKRKGGARALPSMLLRRRWRLLGLWWVYFFARLVWLISAHFSQSFASAPHSQIVEQRGTGKLSLELLQTLIPNVGFFRCSVVLP